ncbi:hypothetical protein WICMUC_001232 [Wickerhamomyces mucosus]|uniref:NAD(P)-binding protein n=1 Tax=Wickerhamomyces mucosus TaxID=1378264 RepID=A0A9P8PV81_9ASCO|nr:hypothetical protein WICMUC_001232 [Wickerhamomyces mucosus]
MSGKVYFITGGNQGIGFQLVKQLSELNPKNTVITGIRDISNPSEDLKQLSVSNNNVKFIELDISSQSSIDSFVENLIKATPNGSIDVFIQNAGIGKDFKSTVNETDRSKWIEHYQTNSLGPILTFQKLYPLLKKSDVKQAIFISSLLGSISGYVPRPSGAYGQSKAALNYSIRSLSHELGPEGFTFIAVHPGVVSTKLYSKAGLNSEAITAEESAKLQIDYYEKLTPELNGTYWSIKGEVLPW